ncbi:MAG: hypothetical protein ACFWTZ_05365 [Burkholderia sp.]|jgi:soluble lytic murein transglycosylase
MSSALRTFLLCCAACGAAAAAAEPPAGPDPKAEVSLSAEALEEAAESKSKETGTAVELTLPQAAQPAAAEAPSADDKLLETALLPFAEEPGDEAFKSAWQAYRRGRLESLIDASADASLAGYPLADYLTLWRLNLQLKRDEYDQSVIDAYLKFIDAHQGQYLGERSASDFLMAKKDELTPELFDRLYQRLQWNKEEPPILAWHYWYAFDSVPIGTIKTFLRETNASGEPYRALNDRVIAADPSWAWNSAIILLQKRRYAELRHVLDEADEAQLPASKADLRAITDNPKRWIARHSAANGKTALFTALRLANADQDKAADYLNKTLPRMTAADRSLALAYLGYESAKDLNVSATSFFDRAGTSFMKHPLFVKRDRAAGWAVRAYLRAGSWKRVNAMIGVMSADAQAKESWTYWKARALAAMKRPAEAEPLYRRIAGNVSFYGKLACDELGIPYAGETVHDTALTEAAKKRWSSDAGIARARTFYRLELYGLGHREWNWSMRGLKGRDYIELAAYALDERLIHRMINTSARAGNGLVSFSQLYPMPHRSAVTRIADEQGVSPAWVYGIIRQESRFMPSASSSVGARGLMQIMPATERWLVRKLAMPSQAESGLSPLDWNMTLGSAYLGMLLDKFDGSYVLASAAYNAGAGRSRAWRRALDVPMEAAVFIETIPFYETRGYVKNVLSNTQTYATIAHRAQGRFKDFIGSVAPAEAETDSDMP